MEKYLQEKIFPDLERGRPNWDNLHTLAVVGKIKWLIENNPKLNLDRNVLIIAAYAHDWGYADLFENNEGKTFKGVEAAKEKHMEIGAKKTKEMLLESFFDFLTREQKEKIVRLVLIHDKVDEIKDVDEIIFLEADTLATLDTGAVKPNFSREDNKKYMNSEVLKDRLAKFTTDVGKKEAERLFKKREEY